MLTQEMHPDKALIGALELPNGRYDLAELATLVAAAGAEVVGEVVQKRNNPQPASYFGKGKIEEIAALALATEATMLVIDSELAPSQIRNLEDAVGVYVLDRSQLIIDIFAQRARTYEGQLQVEIAQLTYALPRLTGRGTEMSRLGAGIGTRGPGETKLEYDRRRIRESIRDLRKEVDKIKRHRKLLRASRVRRGHPLVSLIGYTNAGKSTLLNALTRSNIFTSDMLFATLDPTTRILDLPDGQEIAITDTVGFVSRLPHMLIDAFHATLEEVVESDLLLHVVDAAGEQVEEQMAAVQSVLQELGAQDKRQIVVYNKADLLPKGAPFVPLHQDHPWHLISAAKNEGLDELRRLIAMHLPDLPLRVTYILAHSQGDVVHWLHSQGSVIKEDYGADGIKIEAKLRKAQIRQAEKLFKIEAIGESNER